MATYQLSYPITVIKRVAGGAETRDEITEVEVRRLNAGDMRWLEQQADKPGKSLGLVGRLTNLAPATVDMLDAEDVAGISDLVASFLPPSLGSGSAS